MKNRMTSKRTNLIGLLGMILMLTMLATACNPATPAPAAVSNESSESEGGGEHANESGSEHDSGSEGGGGSEGGEGSAGGDSQEGGGANALALNETFDTVQAGARLVLNYDAGSNAFIGQVENTTSSPLTRVRVEVHLSNGTELGPTTPTDVAPGEVLAINLPATAAAFDSWAPHAEVGSGDGNSSGEAGESGQNDGGSEGSGESGDPSSPILALDESWDGVVNGVRTAMSYDATSGTFSGIVENTTAQTLCFVQIELNLKQGSTTVVELGPQPTGDLALGQQVPVALRVADEPLAQGVQFDAWEIHPEVFDYSGSGPVNSEGSGEGSEEHDGG